MNANKILLNVAKTEVILLKPKIEQLGIDLKLKLCRRRLYTTTQVRYLSILIRDKLNWNTHANSIVSKLIGGNSILSKLRYVNFLQKKALPIMSFAPFNSH